VGAINHFFALSNPALVSAPLKKSFSSANCPIFACSVLMSGSLSALTALEPPSNTSAARSSNCRFHSVNKLDAETVRDFYIEVLEKRISRFFEEYGESGRTLLRSKFTIAEPTPEATETPLCLSQNICPAPAHWVADNPPEFFLDVSLEHPSIPGLMLSREQRMSYDELEYLMNGKQARESLRQKVARIKWVQIEKK
jgi:hypothetical protein